MLSPNPFRSLVGTTGFEPRKYRVNTVIYGDKQVSKMTKRLTFQTEALPTRMSLCITITRIFHELLSRDRGDGRATWQSQGVGSEAYLNGMSQEPTPEDARKDGHIRGCSKLFVKYPG